MQSNHLHEVKTAWVYVLGVRAIPHLNSSKAAGSGFRRKMGCVTHVIIFINNIYTAKNCLSS